MLSLELIAIIILCPFCLIRSEAACGGNIGLIEEGDIIEIDIPSAKINAKVSDEEFARRREKAVPREPNVKSGWLYRYAKLVGPSCKGAVMSED